MKISSFRAHGTIEQPFGKRLAKKSIAQGTIEYLVVIAVVVVVGLVVVGLLASFLGSSENVFDNSSNIKNKVGVGGISIVDAVASVDANGLVVLKNVSSETLTITKINIDGVDHNYSEQIVFGETKSFKLKDIDVCDGTKKSYTVVIYYISANSSIDKSANFETITIDCTGTVITPNNVVEEDIDTDEEVLVPDGLVAQYTMNETSGTTINDGSGNAHNGTALFGADTMTIADGKFGNALHFDSVDGIDITGWQPSEGSAPWSFSLWMRTTTPAQWYYVLSWGGYTPENAGEHIDLTSQPTFDPTKLGLYGGTTTFESTGTPAINDGEWHHVVVTFDGVDAIMYIDNVVQNVGGTAIGLDILADNNLRLGYGGVYENDSFIGDLDNVQFYSDVLTSEEVTVLFGATEE